MIALEKKVKAGELIFILRGFLDKVVLRSSGGSEFVMRIKDSKGGTGKDLRIVRNLGKDEI